MPEECSPAFSIKRTERSPRSIEHRPMSISSR
jgi:hypothetical protein